VFEDACMGASSVRRWMKHFKDRNMDVAGSHAVLDQEVPQLNMKNINVTYSSKRTKG
jgi:hypothetical protein